MRLIDADKLMAEMKKAEAEPAYQHTGEDWYVGMISAEGFVDEAETVEAIPVNWIEEYLAWLKGIGAFALPDANAIKSMLKKWEMEQGHSGCGPDYCEI